MKIPNRNRRRFIKKAALGSVASVSITEIVYAAIDPKMTQKKKTISDNNTVLFQGDSITDAGRNKKTNDYNTTAALGAGYAMIAAAEMLHQHPAHNLKFYNKGISGNKVYQLAERWNKDCLELQPDIISILVGVNDYWHMAKHGYNGTIEDYRKDYLALLDRTRQNLPDVKLIIGEPFAVPGIKAVDDSWYPAFDEYRAAAKEVANQYEAVFIPYQKVFDEAIKKAPGSYWTYDGVHPTLAGSQLMASAWLKVVDV